MTDFGRLLWTTTHGDVDGLKTGYPDDAGIDLALSQPAIIPPGGTMDLHTGIAVKFPDNVWGLILGRSSTLRLRGLIVNPGVIDTGFTGELLVCVHNPGADWVPVTVGERLGQLILLPNITAQVARSWVHTLPVTERGTKGFGSTGL